MRRFWAIFILCLLPIAAAAQQAATLVADRVSLSPSGQLVAQGNVQVFFDGTTLTATSVTYDQASDQLTIAGPIVIQEPNGNIFTAEQAQLDPKLRAGLLISARLVLNDQLQLAAAQIEHTAGTSTRMTQVGATSCSVCDGRPPLWEIRAQSVLHDQAAQQLYFDDAVLRVRGVPVLWVPYLRMPDPTLTRATGLLRPAFRSTDQLGFGVKLPYFWRIGDHRDITLTPYISSETNTLEWQYRQAFARGTVTVDAAVSRDTILAGETRGYINVSGLFDMPRDYTLQFSGTAVTDKSYLLDYGYGSDQARLSSNIRIERITGTTLRWAEVEYYTSLSTTDDSQSLPPLVFDLGVENRLFTDLVPSGSVTYGLSTEAHFRDDDSSADTDRDVLRIGAYVDGHSAMHTTGGLVIDAFVGAHLDYYAYNDDPAYENGLRGGADVALTLRYPLIATGANATHIVEPLIMVGSSANFGADIANEDSTRTEFDESNILTLNRFAGDDVQTSGSQVAAGVHWHQFGHGRNLSSRLFIGRVFSLGTPDGSYSSGLSGTSSDWLLAGQIELGNGILIDGRTLLNDSFAAGKTEVGALWSLSDLDLSANYIWLPADPDEDRAAAVSEWRLTADYDINDNWSLGLDGRYDIVAGQPARAGLRLGWQNECMRVALSASRRYASSTTVETTTDYDLSFDLLGFGTSASGAGARRVCTN